MLGLVTTATLERGDAMSLRNFLGLIPAMEEDTSGKAQKEIEHIVYGRLTDFAQLSNAASRESQEQWQVKLPKTELNAAESAVRVRMTQIEGADPNYYLTLKSRAKVGNLEATLSCGEDMFTMMKFAADFGMIKDRYRFPVPNTELVWEVDVFKKPDGTYHDWVKIDLEVDDLSAPLPELPLKFADVILPTDLEGPDKEKHNATLDTLYTSVFKTPNQYKDGGSDTDAPATDSQEETAATEAFSLFSRFSRF